MLSIPLVPSIDANHEGVDKQTCRVAGFRYDFQFMEDQQNSEGSKQRLS